MIQGGFELSRARGLKAQKRSILTQQQSQENLINFHKPRNTRIELVPRSRGQERLVMGLLDESVSIVVASGPAGTGKTYLAMLAAIRALRDGDCDRIVLTRPAVGVEDERHGFLPGDLVSKMEPWTRPLLDVMREHYHPRDIVTMIQDQIVEIAPLAFMRGRTFKRSWVIADEMQNATPAQIKMLLTRIGEGTKIVVTGDVEQADRKRADNGLLDLTQKLSQQRITGMLVCDLGMRDVQRHALIEPVLALYSG
jgi:phosphate starvation-inducible PhoH-like protein